MTSFVHNPIATAPVAMQHRLSFNGGRGLAALLLSAIVSALLVVADQIIETWADGHLMMTWIGLWVVGFIATVLLAGTVRRFSANVIQELDDWSARVAQTRADERLWAIALKDARVMADLQAALNRADARPVVSPSVADRVRAHWMGRTPSVA